MFIKLDEWYYHSSMCGYQTKPLIVNIDEISDVQEKYDPNHNIDGSIVNMKNGNHYNVKQPFQKIIKMMENAYKTGE